MEVDEVETADGGTALVVNATEVDVPPEQLGRAVGSVQPLIAAMVNWTREVHRRPAGRQGSLLDRDRYVTPQSWFDKVRLARRALSDDAVGNVAETTEALAFRKMFFQADDEDEEDAWNQWAALVNLDARVREMWQSMFTDAAATVAVWWGRETFRVRGTTPAGVAKRKTFDLQVPTAFTLIDNLKVVPVGNLMFNQERLAYIATVEEADSFDRALGINRYSRQLRPGVTRPPRPVGLPMLPPPDGMLPVPGDEVVSRLIEAHYSPTLPERSELYHQGVQPDLLYLLRQDSVFRHHKTKPQYERFPRLPIESVFELLDLKAQLRHMDRTHLLAGINFIILVRLAPQKDDPAGAASYPQELAHLEQNAQRIGSVPLLIGPERLQVDIITPKQDTTLSSEKWDALDRRIDARLYRMFLGGAAKGPGADPEKLGKLIGANLMSDRQMLVRTLESQVFRRIARLNPDLGSMAKLRFHPARIALEFDAAMATYFFDLRQMGDLSRDTMLGMVDVDESDEARMIQREREQYDPIFQTAVPFNSPANQPGGQQPVERQPGRPPDGSPAARRAAGRTQGGTRGGGGAAPGSGQGQAPRRPGRVAAAERSHRSLLAEARELQIPRRSRMSTVELAEAIDDALGVAPDEGAHDDDD